MRHLDQLPGAFNQFPIEQQARPVPICEMGSNLKALHLAFFLLFFSSLSVFGQWFPVDSGTMNNLNGAYLLDSGTGFVVGEAGTILKTTDAGATWVPLTSGTARTLHDVYLFNPDEGVAVGEPGLILRTTDGGAAWQRVASGVQDSLRSVFFSGVNGICGGDSQTILYSTDSGASWQIGQTGFFGGGFPGAHMLSPSIGFVAGQNSIFQPLVGSTTDGGVSWNFHAFYFDNNEGGCTDIRFLDQNTGVVSGIVFDGRGAIARTTDGGLNWSTLFFDQAIEGIDFPAADIGFAVGWAGGILRTNDSGVTWNEQTSGTSANLNDVSFASDGLTGIAVGESGIILRTTDGGEPSPITLSAAKRKVGGINTVRLTWSGANSVNIDVYRDAVLIVTTANDGSYTDSTGDTDRARYTYRVCEAGTATCSNDARVIFRQ
jgi:photosystem II stability/assembly factor-like uncharacterized protein